MQNGNSVNVLTGFGLTNYEAKIYLALLEKSQLSATEIAKLTKVPRTCVYDDLKTLEQKGLCRSITGKAKLYSAVAPSIVQDSLRESEQERVNSKIMEYQTKIKDEEDLLVRKYEEMGTLVERLTTVYEKSKNGKNPLNYLEIIMTRIQVHRKFVALIDESREEILGFHKYPLSSATREQTVQSVNSFQKAESRNVKIKGVCELPENKNERESFLKTFFKNYEPGKDQLRIIQKLPMKLTVFDSKVVLFSLSEPTIGVESMCVLVARSETLAGSFKEFFEMYWNKAEDPEKYRKSGNSDV